MAHARQRSTVRVDEYRSQSMCRKETCRGSATSPTAISRAKNAGSDASNQPRCNRTLAATSGSSPPRSKKPASRAA